MACDRMERKIARAQNQICSQRGYLTDRELVQYLLKEEREREAGARRAQFHLVKG